MTADSPDAAASDAERSARVSLAAVAAVGCAETGAITADKLWGGGALGAMCSSVGGGCADVLSGPWASVGPLPLASLGLAAYGGVAALALAPLSRGGEARGAAGDGAALCGADLLLALGGGMAAFELALLGRLLQLQAACGLCLLSAGLSAAVLALVWRLPSTRRTDEDAVLAGCGAALAAAAAAAIFSAQGSLPVPEEEQAARRGVALSAASRRHLGGVSRL